MSAWRNRKDAPQIGNKARRRGLRPKNNADGKMQVRVLPRSPKPITPMPKPSKSKAIAVIDGQIRLAHIRLAEANVRLAEAEAAAEAEKCGIATLEETRNRVLVALATRKKPERAAKTIPLQEAASG